MSGEVKTRLSGEGLLYSTHRNHQKLCLMDKDHWEVNDNQVTRKVTMRKKQQQKKSTKLYKQTLKDFRSWNNQRQVMKYLCLKKIKIKSTVYRNLKKWPSRFEKEPGGTSRPSRFEKEPGGTSRNENYKNINEKLNWWGLPSWSNGWESTFQCRGHGFDPWSGKRRPYMPLGQVDSFAATEPGHLT